VSDLIVVRSQSRSPAETGLAWCSLKHFRAIYGSVAVEKAAHLHADPCQTGVPAVEGAQVQVVSQLPLQDWMFTFRSAESLDSSYFTAVIVSFLRELLGSFPLTLARRLSIKFCLPLDCGVQFA